MPGAELEGWDLYAVDGHHHHAACFDKKFENSQGELRVIDSGLFFRMNMRTHHLSCLGMATGRRIPVYPQTGRQRCILDMKPDIFGL